MIKAICCVDALFVTSNNFQTCYDHMFNGLVVASFLYRFVCFSFEVPSLRVGPVPVGFAFLNKSIAKICSMWLCNIVIHF